MCSLLTLLSGKQKSFHAARPTVNTCSRFLFVLAFEAAWDVEVGVVAGVAVDGGGGGVGVAAAVAAVGDAAVVDVDDGGAVVVVVGGGGGGDVDDSGGVVRFADVADVDDSAAKSTSTLSSSSPQ